MSFSNGGGSGGGALSTSSDVVLNAPADGHVLTYEADIAKWKNAALPLISDMLLAGANITLSYDAGTGKTTIAANSTGSSSNVIILTAAQTEPPAGTPAGTIILREVS